MASVHDVARYILREMGELDTWKLQKLVYYSQAWHLVWEDEALFNAEIQAWANGPVVPELYGVHRGQYRVGSWSRGSIQNLSRSERESIDVVLDHYGRFSGFQLREMTHSESPWKDARRGLPPGAPSENVITPASISSYYNSL
jgi:uncharacterized phage-associated protein